MAGESGVNAEVAVAENAAQTKGNRFKEALQNVGERANKIFRRVPNEHPHTTLQRLAQGGEDDDPLASPKLSPLSSEQFKSIDTSLLIEEDTKAVNDKKVDEPKNSEPLTETVLEPMRVIQRTEISGSTEGLTFVKVAVPSKIDGEEQIVSYVSKKPNVFGATALNETERYLPYSDKFIAVWQKLKDAGLPVIPEVIKVSNDEVYLTDLTADGSVLYDKYAVNNMNTRNNPPIDNIFAQLNREEIFAKAEEIFHVANEKKITLPGDDPLSLVVRPNGSWELVVLDIGDTQFNDVYSEERNTKNLLLFKSLIASLHTRIQNPPIRKPLGRYEL